MEDVEFVEYLKLQDNLDMCSKTELLEALRDWGAPVSARQLTTYVTEGLVPKSARVGSRSGVYPKIICELLYWIEQSRRRGLSIEAIKQLVPSWRFLRAGLRDKEIDLGKFQELAEQTITHEEAGYALPMLFISCLPCPIHDDAGNERLAETKFVLKDGTRRLHEADRPMSIGFSMIDPKEPSRCSATRITIPLHNESSSSSTISLAIDRSRPGAASPGPNAEDSRDVRSRVIATTGRN